LPSFRSGLATAWYVHIRHNLNNASLWVQVSYYINLVLEGVGISGTRTKASINAGLQVTEPAVHSASTAHTYMIQVFNLCVAVSASFLVDYLGRRTLFIISNSGMLFSFLLWTISEAIFNDLHKAAAAKGK
jgi:hypothetical protein